MSEDRSLAKYAGAFRQLNTDKSAARWDAPTRYRAPHKPLLLLSVLDLVADGSIQRNLIELIPDLRELFDVYWSRVRPAGRERGPIIMPFFHLRSDGFWHLLPKPGQEDFLARVPRIRSAGLFEETILGARLDQDLFHLLQIEEYREALRHVLVETYFDPATQERLLRQSAFNYQVAAYSSDLLERARKQIREKPVELKEDPVRDQGFRRAIVRAYNHRCSLCGVRILTAEGHTAIAAAHIIPWRVSHDDDPRNGLALCHLCHWTFDEGLVTVGNNYQIRMSPQLAHSENVPGHLATIADRDLIGPSEESLWPFKESLQWHRQEVFRRR